MMTNDVKLNDERDDENMDDGETGNIRDPGQPKVYERQERMTTHRPHRSWCKFCVMGRGVNSPHRRSDAQGDLEGVHSRFRWTMDFLVRTNLKNK